MKAIISVQFINSGDPQEVVECLRNVVAGGCATIEIQDEQEIGAAFITTRIEEAK